MYGKSQAIHQEDPRRYPPPRAQRARDVGAEDRAEEDRQTADREEAGGPERAVPRTLFQTRQSRQKAPHSRQPRRASQIAHAVEAQRAGQDVQISFSSASRSG